MGPAAGARERMRAAALAGGPEGEAAPTHSQSQDPDVELKVSEDRPKTLPLVETAVKGIGAAAVARPPVSAAIPRVVATALSGIPEMPRANAVPAAF